MEHQVELPASYVNFPLAMYFTLYSILTGLFACTLETIPNPIIHYPAAWVSF